MSVLITSILTLLFSPIRTVNDYVEAILTNKFLMILHNLFLISLIYKVFSSLTRKYLINITPLEETKIKDNFFSIGASALLIFTIFSRSLTMYHLPFISYIVIIKFIIWHLFCRIKMVYDRKYEQFTAIVLGILLSTFTYSIYQCRNVHSIFLYFAYEQFLSIIDFAKITYHLIYIKDREPGEYKTVEYYFIDASFLACKIAGSIVFIYFTSLRHRIPYNVVRDIAVLMKNFRKKILGLIGVKNINRILERAEVQTTGECLICTDIIDNNGRRLECGHYFHPDCLRQWVWQQQVCPVCRMKIN